MGQYIYSPPPPGSALTIYHYHFRDIRSQMAGLCRADELIIIIIIIILYNFVGMQRNGKRFQPSSRIFQIRRATALE